jgi:hypothetical protein
VVPVLGKEYYGIEASKAASETKDYPTHIIIACSNSLGMRRADDPLNCLINTMIITISYDTAPSEFNAYPSSSPNELLFLEIRATIRQMESTTPSQYT